MIDPTTFNFDRLDNANISPKRNFKIIYMIVIVAMVTIGYNSLKSKIINNEKDK
jgi:hypothetical protein